ncbi:hypothetical protein DFH06DRAFT_670945 [Mycena polygramma]|nr:hypothetical protein DFH06DRAFT_670945 [Mycena polygramma]
MSSSSAVPSPSSSASSTSDPNSNLYLFTFLATLILLLVVSSAVLARAVFVRRRFRRTVDRALEQGLVLSQQQFVAPPKLFDVYLDDTKHPLPSWAGITPISVQPVPAAAGELFSDSKSTVSSNSSIRSDGSLASVQVSVLVAMPQPPAASTDPDPDYLPEVVLGFTQSHYPS